MNIEEESEKLISAYLSLTGKSVTSISLPEYLSVRMQVIEEEKNGYTVKRTQTDRSQEKNQFIREERTTLQVKNSSNLRKEENPTSETDQKPVASNASFEEKPLNEMDILRQIKDDWN